MMVFLEGPGRLKEICLDIFLLPKILLPKSGSSRDKLGLGLFQIGMVAGGLFRISESESYHGNIFLIVDGVMWWFIHTPQ